MKVPRTARCWVDGCDRKVRAHVHVSNDDFGLLTCRKHLLAAAEAQSDETRVVGVMLYDVPR